MGWEWCIDLEVVKTTPVLEPMAQLNIGADFKFVAPEGDKLRGHIRARDPVTGKVSFEIPYAKAPPHASVLSTGGNLLFVPEADGMLTAYDARNGKKLWTSQQRARPQRGHHLLLGQGQAVRCGDDRLGQPGERRLR